MNTQRQANTILIIQTAFLGDVILTTPLIPALQEGIPGCEIDFLTIPKSKNIIDSNPGLRRVILFDKKGKDRSWAGLRKLGNDLAENRYSICLTPHRSWRSAYLTYRTRAAIRIGFTTSSWSGAFTHRIEYRSDHHETERNLALLGPLQIPARQRLPELYPTTEDHRVVEKLLAEISRDRQSPLFAIAPGSIWPTKRWPAERYVKVVNYLAAHGFRIILVGGREDVDLCGQIASSQDQCLSLAGQLTMRQTCYLLRSCLGLLTNDSAPLHLGMAASIPVFAIFGATLPEFGFAPFGKNGYIFENRNIVCRPCGIHGGKHCPVRTFLCMESIEPERVAEKISTVITKAN